MPEYYYKEALKLGLKEAKAASSKSDTAMLPALDELLKDKKTAGEVNLGLVPIPAERIVGTKSVGRVNAFAPNFMPIMDEGTEFADKWEHLCQSHLSDGIREPIKAYEYMNRFYVEEGNKRVSVLKFFDAVHIMGTVIRVLPEKTDDEEVDRYYEFVDFYKYSKVNFIEFTVKGSYLKLQKALGKEPGEEWSEEDRKAFSAAYYYFRKAYLSMGGEKLQSSTAADAMLSYIQVYSYQELTDTTAADIEKNLSKMWEEVELKEEQTPIEVKTDPPAEKKASVLTKVLSPSEPPVMKVAFIYDGTPEKSGWVHDHETGRRHIQTVFHDRIDTEIYRNAMEGDPVGVIEQAVEDGAGLIFTTSPRFMQASLRVAVDHPDVIIMNCSLNKSHRYVRSYYTRMYEAKFILGAIAGSLCESGRLGYVCDYPIFGQIAGINAFALGAQMANPRVKVYLEWTSIKDAKEIARSMEEQGIRLISSQDTSRFLFDERSSFGLSYVNGEQRELLATPVWKWGVYYERILNRVFDKSMQEEYKKSNKALNYYWGMSAGVVDVEYAATLPRPARRFGDLLRKVMIQEAASPFLTPIIAQNGDVIGKETGELTLDQIISMDYLVENVVGDIPLYDALTPMGKATVDAVGIEKAKSAADTGAAPVQSPQEDTP